MERLEKGQNGKLKKRDTFSLNNFWKFWWFLWSLVAKNRVGIHINECQPCGWIWTGYFHISLLILPTQYDFAAFHKKGNWSPRRQSLQVTKSRFVSVHHDSWFIWKWLRARVETQGSKFFVQSHCTLNREGEVKTKGLAFPRQGGGATSLSGWKMRTKQWLTLDQHCIVFKAAWLCMSPNLTEVLRLWNGILWAWPTVTLNSYCWCNQKLPRYPGGKVKATAFNIYHRSSPSITSFAHISCRDP